MREDGGNQIRWRQIEEAEKGCMRKVECWPPPNTQPALEPKVNAEKTLRLAINNMSTSTYYLPI